MGGSESTVQENPQYKKMIEQRIKEARQYQKSDFKKSYSLIKKLHDGKNPSYLSRTIWTKQKYDTKEDQYWYLLASCYYKNSFFQQALQIHNEQLKKNSSSTYHLQGAGDCLRHLERYAEGQKFYFDADQSLLVLKRQQIKYRKAQINNSWGLNLMDQGFFRQATKKFQTAVKIDIKNPLYYCNLAAAYSANGQKEQSNVYYKKTSKLLQDTKETQLQTFLSKEHILYLKETLNTFVQDLQDLYLKNRTNDKIYLQRLNAYGSKPYKLAQTLPQHKKTNVKDPQLTNLQNVEARIFNIKQDQQLKEFYTGFMGSLGMQYQQAGTIMSKLVKLNTQTIIGLLASNLALFFLGPIAALAVDKFSNYVQQEKIKQRAQKLRHLRFIETEYISLMQDVSIAVSQKVKILLPIVDSQKTFLKWCSFLDSILERLKQKVAPAKQFFFGKKAASEMQIFGQRIAIQLISEQIASGKLYAERQPIKIPDHELKTGLIQSALKIFEDNLVKKNYKN